MSNKDKYEAVLKNHNAKFIKYKQLTHKSRIDKNTTNVQVEEAKLHLLTMVSNTKNKKAARMDKKTSSNEMFHQWCLNTMYLSI